MYNCIIMLILERRLTDWSKRYNVDYRDSTSVGIPMGTICVPLVEDLFRFVIRDTSSCLFLTIIKLMLFNSTSRYVDDLLDFGNPYFEQMEGKRYPTELQLNKANPFDTEAPPLMNLYITKGKVLSTIYDNRNEFEFKIVNFRFLDRDVTRFPSCGVYISQLILSARVCSNVTEFNNRNFVF